MVKVYAIAAGGVAAAAATSFVVLFGLVSGSATLAAVTTPRTYVAGAALLISVLAVGLAVRWWRTKEVGGWVPGLAGVLLVLLVLFEWQDLRFYAQTVFPHRPARQTAPNHTHKIDVAGMAVTNQDYSKRMLERSNFNQAVLTNVNFDEADLNESNFRDAVFQHVNFHHTLLCAVDVRGADLTGAEGLEESELGFMLYDKATKFPKSFGAPIGPSGVEGPVLSDDSTSLLYACKPGATYRLERDGTRR